MGLLGLSQQQRDLGRMENFKKPKTKCKLIQSLWKTVWRFLKKLGIKPPYDPAIPLLGIYPETKIEKDMYSIVHCSTIYNSENMEAT